MEVMQRAVVKNRTLKPLPGEITDARIRDATLPLKVEAARRAIAACTDLPELLKLKDQAEGLAAAVRIMKTVGPEMIRDANCLLADAWRKGGELLSAYSVAAPTRRGKDGGGAVGPSPRQVVGRTIGLSPTHIRQMSRVAAAPKEWVYDLAQKSHSLTTVSNRVPPVGRGGPVKYSGALRGIMGDSGRLGAGLTQGFSYLKRIPTEYFSQLQPEERKVVKAKITEITELLDEMDRLCR